MTIKRRTQIDDVANQVKKSVGSKRSDDAPVEFFPTGSTTLNLALCGRPDVGWPRARIHNTIGDPSAGKSLLAIEQCFNFLKYIPSLKTDLFPKVKKVHTIYNNREGVMDFPLSKMYGSKFRNSVDWRNSRFIEDLGADIIKTIERQKEGTAILYVADSWDAFPAIAESKRFCQSVKEEGELKGSFNQEKNKYAQDFFEEVSDLLRDNRKDFTLNIISQTRDNIGVMFGAKKRRSGGAALDFYTHLGIWIREILKLIKKKHGEERIYGIESEVQVKRSKVSKPFRKSKFRILYDHGLDDIGSMMTYLKDHKKSKFKGYSLSDPAKFINFIEKNNYEKALRRKVYKMWNKIEKSFDDEVTCRKQKCL